jgi:uncharacterized membrane protein
MNLDPVGWIHTVASLIALVTGAIVIVRQKGTAAHKLNGRIYVLATIVICLTSFAIYRLNKFWFPHWFAVASLVVTTIGFAFAHFQWPRMWVHLHLTCMIASYYILIGGGVNEVFLRIDALRSLAPDVLNSPIVDRAHSTVMIVFALLVAYFNAALLLRRPRAAQ